MNDIITTNPMCQGATKVEGTPCTHPGKYLILMYVKGTSAYRLDALPKRYLNMGHPWAQAELPLCGSHNNLLMGKGNIRINNYVPAKEGSMEMVPTIPFNEVEAYKNPNIPKEDEITVEEEQMQFQGIENVEVKVERPKISITCANKDCEVGWHITAAEVAECMGVDYTKSVVNQIPNKGQHMEFKLPNGRVGHYFPSKVEADTFNRENRYGIVVRSKKQTGWCVYPTSDHPYGNQTGTKPVKGVKCGKCKEMHPTTDDVRACYAQV